MSSKPKGPKGRGDRGRIERRTRRRRTARIDPRIKPDLPGAMIAKGWTVAPTDADGADDAGLIVVGPDDPAVAEAIAVNGDACMAVLAESSDPRVERAAAATAHLYDPHLSVTALVALLEKAAELWGRTRRRDQAERRRILVIDLGLSVELDGRPLPLGLGARNFLYQLASRPGERIAKDAKVEAGRRKVPARQCRRDLGRDLGPATARLLVPEQRGEPYRLRTPTELTEMNAPLKLQIKGRSGPPLTFRPDLD